MYTNLISWCVSEPINAYRSFGLFLNAQRDTPTTKILQNLEIYSVRWKKNQINYRYENRYFDTVAKALQISMGIATTTAYICYIYLLAVLVDIYHFENFELCKHVETSC